MRKNEANFFLFAASIIIGILIAMNISFNKGNTTSFLSSVQYQDAYNYKNQLYGDISSLVDQYNTYEIKLENYQANEKNNASITDEIDKELADNNMILGKVPVQGQGVLIVLNDADSKYFNNTIDDQFRLVHNTDIIQVLNDLKNAGAEAVSINNQRIVDSSEIYCSGPFLRVNSVKIAAPFTINAIGNEEVIYDYMMSDENYLKSLMMRKINVSIKKSDSVKVPAFVGNQKVDFMKEE
jgi:uncharacterized protein YlxW (UPF0749 family)